VINWRTEEIIAIRNSGPNPIFDLAVDPYNKLEFVTGGFQNVTIWEINNKNLIRKSIVNLYELDPNTENPCIITCVAYISFNVPLNFFIYFLFRFFFLIIEIIYSFFIFC
jgi:hypothetical protein